MATTPTSAPLAGSDSASLPPLVACDAVRELCAHSCVSIDRASDGGCDSRALHLSLAPLPASTAYEHECVLGFVFADEMKGVRQLQRKLREGQALVRDIYCTRSCARAFSPMAPDADVAQTNKYYMTLFTILEPQAVRLKALSDYCAQTVVMLSDNIQRITVHENTTRVIPDVLMDALLGVIDVVLQLSQFHDTKSSLRSDFSVYKRAFAHVRGSVANAELVEHDIQRLQDFVGNSSQAKGSIWDALRHNLTNVKRFDQVVYLLLQHCLAHIAHDTCILPEHKFQFIRVLPSLLAVLEESRLTTKSSSAHRTAEKKAIDAAARVLLRFPVVPLFAEVNAMPVAAFQLPSSATTTATSPTHKSDANATNSENATKHLDPAFDLPAVVLKMQRVCRELLPRLVHALNQAAACSSNGHSVSIEQNATLYDLVLEALVAASDWKSSLLLFVAFKYQFPKATDAHVAVASPFLTYERLTKYNFSNDELSAIADVVYCVKAVVQLLLQHAHVLAASVQRYVYRQTQQFVQHTALPLLHRAHKRKLVCSKLLHDARMACGDWSDPKTTADDYIKRRKDRTFPVLRDRTAAPTLCQLQMLASLVNAVYAKRSMGALNAKHSTTSSLFSFKKDLDTADIDALQQFYRDASVFPSLLRLTDTLDDLRDFSCLWLRELYLEITKCPQFPTDTSLPWMLMDHCLQRTALPSSPFCSTATSELGLKPVLAVVDIYNDAATSALFILKRQVLFDEAEAEGTLCFDQLVYTLAHQLYTHARSSSRALVSDASTETSSKRLSDNVDARTLRRSTRSLYDWVAHAKRVDVAGESHSLTHLLAQHVHVKLTRDVDKWLSQLEASDATSLLDAATALDALRRAHATLSTLVPLDRFDDVLHDVDAELAQPDEDDDGSDRTQQHPLLLPSRLQHYVSQIVLLDLCQHFSFNVRAQCFERVPLPSELEASSVATTHFGDVVVDKHTKDMCAPLLRRVASSLSPRSHASTQAQVQATAAARRDNTLFGTRHVGVLLELLAPDQVLDIVNDCSDFVEAKIADVLQLCIPALGLAIPPFRFPRFMYRLEGCVAFFESKFKHVLEESNELEAHVFHCFREIGNGLAFLLLLSDAVDARAALLVRNATPKDATSSHLYCHGVFRRVLQRLRAMLHTSEIATAWAASTASHPEAIANTASFYHVWSTLEFLSCRRGTQRQDTSSATTTNGNAPLCDQFGDGVQLAGCVLVHVLAQRELYELWSVNSHVLRVYRQEQTAAATTSLSKASSSKMPLTTKVMRKAAPSVDASSVGTLGVAMQSRAAAFAATAARVRQTTDAIYRTLDTASAARASATAGTKAGSSAAASRHAFRPATFVPPPVAMTTPVPSTLS